MFCWGNARDGQLGLGVEKNPVYEPKACQVFFGRGLKEITCAGEHTVFLLQDGSVYTCGSNSCGQLGHDKPGTSPELVGALDTQKISSISCGQAHSLAVNEQGQVFAWGAGDGALSLKSTVHCLRFPQTTDALSLICFSWIYISLYSDGQLFTWGQNTSGQLGLGKGEPSKLFPQPLKSLAGIPLAQITAGGDHSFALSLSGAVFGWGKNRAGQLGLNDKQDRAVPCHIKFLRSQKVVYISCGEEHTAALTKDGGLFTFGDGSWGQLGHGSTNNELLPRRVLELMGTEVSQIACGRHHTLAFVPSSGLVYAFGCNNFGQLGTGMWGDSKSPCPVRIPFIGCFQKGESEQCIITHIICGGDHSFLLYSYDQVRSNPPLLKCIPIGCVQSTYQPLLIWCVCLCRVFSEKSHTNPRHPCYYQGLSTNLSIYLLTHFHVSSNNLNASSHFLPCFCSEDAHFKTNPKIPGIDISSVRVLFEAICQPPFSGLLEQVYLFSFESLLIPQLPRSPPDVEAMRIYLILSECPLMHDSKNFIRLTIPFAMAILRLDPNPSKVLDNWWCFVEGSVFRRMVDMYKRIVVFMLTLGKTVLVPAFYENYFLATLRLLEKLHKVNQSPLQFCPVNEFPSVNLCAYPFILNARAKTTMLQTDAELQMQMAVSGANLHNVFMLLTLEPQLARNPYMVLHVRRDHLVSDTLRELTMYSDVDLKKPLKVIFDGEEAVDAGGVTKEFFLLLLKELMDPVYGMFTHYKDSNLLWFSDKCFVESNWFHLIGILCGLAIYNSTVVDLHFPLALYKKLLKVSPTLEDFKELSPTEARSLQQLLDYDGNDVEETFLLNFAVSCNIIPGLCLIISSFVLIQQTRLCFRKEFVDAYLRYVFSDSVSEQYNAFSGGFLKVCGGEILWLFQPSELMAMVVGNNNYNWDEMEKNAVYKGEYSATHPTVRLFWEVFHEFPLEKKKQFLLFLTGSDRIPIHGMESLKIVIQSTTAEEHYLPVAHTCYNLLDMPRYQTKDILKQRLTQAVEQYEGFSLV
uniref:HECT and RLD domain containing E3 ubiquitin protein ligase 3 n=1 Tax=Neogobius melanostomus TaxID=47308 RepID=A0A8C6TRC0_9GOBI